MPDLMREAEAAMANAEAALGRYDDGNDRSGVIAQVDMQRALVLAVLHLSEVLRLRA